MLIKNMYITLRGRMYKSDNKITHTRRSNMKTFNVDVKKVNSQVKVLADVGDMVAGCAKKVNGVISTLGAIGLSDIKPAVEQIQNELNAEKEECEALKEALAKIILLYIQQETGLVGLATSLDALIQGIQNFFENNNNTESDEDVVPFEIDSILYDDVGLYGGDQGDANETSGQDREALYKIIANNVSFIDIDDTDMMDAVLARANEEGCGYMALTNSIFAHFENDPEGFEETFGYSMYNENGDLNYDMLFIDFYSSMDFTIPETGEIDHTGHINFDPREDFTYYDNGEIASLDYNPLIDYTGNGTSSADREAYINTFMEQHGLEVKYETDVDVTPSSFQEISEEGKTVIISYHNGYIYDAEGNEERIENHAMVVTGVTEDGKYIVSSWGQEYYLDPNQEFTMTNDYGEEGTTTISFETVSYR